jgi:hypothetical protein
MAYPRGGLLARASPSHLVLLFASVAGLLVLATGTALYGALPRHQVVNRAAKADALVSSRDLKALALKVPGGDLSNGLDEPASLEAPVSDIDVFDTNQRCVAPEDAVQHFQSEQSAVGGKVVMLAEGLQQSFSDAWRVKTHLTPVKVSSVLAHLFEGPAEQWAADVIEFDANKCAMSRTLVPGEAWNQLIRAAVGAQV